MKYQPGKYGKIKTEEACKKWAEESCYPELVTAFVEQVEKSGHGICELNVEILDKMPKKHRYTTTRHVEYFNDNKDSLEIVTIGGNPLVEYIDEQNPNISICIACKIQAEGIVLFANIGAKYA